MITVAALYWTPGFAWLLGWICRWLAVLFSGVEKRKVGLPTKMAD